MSILRRMTVPLVLLVIVQYLLLGGSLYISGLFDKLNTNAVEMLNQKLINRAGYLNNEIESHLITLKEAAFSVNEKVSALLANGTLTAQSIGDGGDNDELLLSAASEDILGILKKNSSTGAFMFVYNGNLDLQLQSNSELLLRGLYLRDTDPLSKLSDNDKIIAKRGSVQITDELGANRVYNCNPFYKIAVDENGHAEYTPFIYEPYQAALKYSVPADSLGYWSMPFMFEGNEIVTYSMPLVLDNGLVYGVIGIDFSTDFLMKIIPSDEILPDNAGSYLIAVSDGYSSILRDVALNGGYSASVDGFTTVERQTDNLCYIKSDGLSDYAACIQELNIYGDFTPFASERWTLLAIAQKDTLFSFTASVIVTIAVAASISLVIGIAVIFVVSYGITTPIHLISKKLSESDSRHIVVLDRINITEIDELSSAVQHLSEDLYSSATKFSRIVKMASVNIGAFEISRDSNSLFITDNFFKIFARPTYDNAELTVEKFSEYMEMLREFVIESNDTNTDVVFRIPYDGDRRYIQLKVMYENDRILGLAEDITAATVEKQKIVYERDYDMLTGLLNRRAFKRSIELACREPEKLYTGFMMMMDLDNLKYIKDTYGHDYGDDYIRAAADSLKSALADYDSSAIISRISGDEFFVFAYGFGGKADARKAIDSVKENIAKKDIRIPNGKEYKLRASGGISWYPSDSTSISQLMKYADFAMYKIKLTTKGKFNEFDRAVYERESFLLHSKGEFNRLVDENCVIYHFQPIVNVKTGKIFAYEALMRSLLPTLKSPYEIITLAKAESKLDQIERLTWMNALSTYANHVDGGAIDSGCKLFINSIINQIISDDDIESIEKQYSAYLGNIVMEIPDESRYNNEILTQKLALMGKWNGQLAVDNYDGGGDKKYLEAISPSYIKIDMTIIRDIDKEFDKQQLVLKVVAYAHERGIEVIAQGVESRAELEKVIDIGVDYIQGYIAAKPQAEPPKVSKEFLRIIGVE